VEEVLATESQSRAWGKQTGAIQDDAGDNDDIAGESKDGGVPSGGEGSSAPPASSSVTWRYKWEPEAEVFGPYSSEQMNEWANQVNLLLLSGTEPGRARSCSPLSFLIFYFCLQGHFAAGVLVCKQGTEEYVSSKRVDFSLYIDD